MRKFLNLTNKNLSDLSAVSYQELWKKAQSDGYEGLSVCVFSEFTKAEDGDNKFHAIFSSSNEDRHGDIVHQDFDLKGFKRNPVFLDSHNYGSIERIIGKVSKTAVKDGKLQGDIEFALDNPLGVLAMKLAAGGFLNTTSIGFIPREFNDKGEMLVSELLEVSAVSVPANKDATFEKKAEAEVVEEAPKPAPEPVEEVAPEPTPAPVAPAPAKALNYTAIAAHTVAKMVEDRNRLLKAIAKDVQELAATNRQEKKRAIFQRIREALNE